MRRKLKILLPFLEWNTLLLVFASSLLPVASAKNDRHPYGIQNGDVGQSALLMTAASFALVHICCVVAIRTSSQFCTCPRIVGVPGSSHICLKSWAITVPGRYRRLPPRTRVQKFASRLAVGSVSLRDNVVESTSSQTNVIQMVKVDVIQIPEEAFSIQ